MSTNGKAFIRGRLLWLAWYPGRGRKCCLRRDAVRFGIGWHVSAGVGPLYLGVGTGTPLP